MSKAQCNPDFAALECIDILSVTSDLFLGRRLEQIWCEGLTLGVYLIHSSFKISHMTATKKYVSRAESALQEGGVTAKECRRSVKGFPVNFTFL